MGYWNNPDKDIFTRTFQEFDATVEIDSNSKWCASIQIASWETPAVIGRYDSLEEAQSAINTHFRKLGIEGDASCDCCNAKLKPEDIPSHLWIVMHGPENWADIQKSAVLFEWSQEGVYCSDCQEKLSDAIINQIPVPERYNNIPENEQIVKEIELIKSAISKR